MYAEATIKKYKETTEGTELIILIPKLNLGSLILQKLIRKLEIRFNDGRHISVEQRKKAYATIRDISEYTGYFPEEQKEWLKYLHISKTGINYFSLSDCSMDVAREFINTIMEYAIQEGVPLSDNAIERTDDIGKYLYYCIKHKKCAVCGAHGEIHHEDAIGMGNDRNRVDDSHYRKICLCRTHHTIAHQMGVIAFRKMYKIYGIIIKEERKADENNYTDSTNYQEKPSTDHLGQGRAESYSQQAI